MHNLILIRRLHTGAAFRARYLAHPACAAAGAAAANASAGGGARGDGISTCLSDAGAEGYGMLGEWWLDWPGVTCNCM